ncbi:MAG: hypothetical protein KKD28_00050 [Chloroflexi bacterium]|nr:hypothetical protein [Chloroflexota bacterium]
MITATDFITIPYTSDLTQAGIAYACRSLPYTYDRMGGSHFNRLRRIVVGVAVELAFRRRLAEEKVPHDNLGSTPFTDPDRYDIAIGGRRCDIKSFMLTRRSLIRHVSREPQALLGADALVPSDQIVSDHLNDEDLYIFAFITALTTPNQRSLDRALKADQPIYLIHPLPKEWAHPSRWIPLGTLALKCDTSHAVTLELGGQNESRAFMAEEIVLEPRKRAAAESDFYALGYLHTSNPPDGIVGVHSPSVGETHLVEPIQWGNIWIYGMQIIFTGYMTRGEFRQRGNRLPAGSRVFKYSSTRTENRSLPIAELHPLSDLFTQAKKWAKRGA